MPNNQIENKIIKKRRGQLPGLDLLDFRYYEGGKICGNWGQVGDNFLKEIVNEIQSIEEQVFNSNGKIRKDLNGNERFYAVKDILNLLI